MKATFILSLLCLLSLAFGEAPKEEDNVLVLTESNFDATVNSADIILVEFYAPWCGHCKHLAPEYAKAAGILKKNDPPVALAKVDATVETSLGNRFSIRGYPTLKVFRKGVASDYNGPREANGIVSYMEKQVGPAAKQLDSVASTKKLLDSNPGDVTIIGFFPQKSGKAYETFVQTSDSLREDFKFGLATDKSILEEYKHSEAIVIFRQEEPKQIVYSGENTVAALKEWISDKSVPLVGEFNQATEKRYNQKGLPLVKLYIDVNYDSNLKRTNYYVNRLRKVAEEFQGKLHFTIVDRTKFASEMDKFGIAGQNPGLAIDDKKASLKYKYTGGEFSVENTKKFVSDWVDGKIKPYIKTQPAPEQVPEEPVVVVGETFNDIVLDNKKDVLIELYAPWCGHCKKLEPIYKDLAKRMKDVPSVTIAKMDATANDSPHGKYQAKGYPTILFAPANNKENPIQYSGDRDVEAFYKWINEKAAIPFPK